MSDNNGNDDNVIRVKGQKAPSIREQAEAAVAKARKESFEAKIKEKVKLQQEQKKAVILAQAAVKKTETEINDLVTEFDSGL